MPLDSVNKQSHKSKTASQQQQLQQQRPLKQCTSMFATGSRFDSDNEGTLPSTFRLRLHDLFGQIEKEFENLYAENQELQDKVETLQERLDVYNGACDKPSADTLDAPDAKPKRSSQISQKIKTTYKASTSRIVSSFRQASTAYSQLRSYRGHRDGVWEVNVSKMDPTVIGTASADHSARIWNIETGACVLQYLGHQGSVNAIRFNPAQDLVITTSGDQTAHIWCPQINLPIPQEIIRSHSSGDDDLDNSEKEDFDDFPDQIIETATLRTPTREFTGHMGVVVSADWLPGGSEVITASWDRTAILYNAETGEQVSTLTGHDLELTEVRTHPTQRLVVTASKDTTFRLWDFRDTNMPVSVFQGHTQPVTSAVFAKQEKVVSGSDDRTVKVWDLRNMSSPIATIRTDSAINRLSVSQNQNCIAIPHDNRNIRLFDIHGNRIGRLPRSNRVGHSKMVCSVAWAEDNTMSNLFSSGFDRQVISWHINLQAKE